MSDYDVECEEVWGEEGREHICRQWGPHEAHECCCGDVYEEVETSGPENQPADH